MPLEGEIHRFSFVGSASRARAFPGFPAPDHGTPHEVGPRQARRLSLAPGDLLSLTALSEQPEAYLLVLDGSGTRAPERLGLTAEATLAPEDIDAAEFKGWARGLGLGIPARLSVATVSLGAEPVHLKAAAACTLWAFCPAPRDALVGGTTTGGFVLAHRRGASTGLHLPDPLGHVRDEFTVPRGTARAYRVARGEVLQIIDIQGQQCSDFMAFRAPGLDAGREEMIDSTATRSLTRRAYPAPGLFDKFYDREMRPLLRLVQDTCGRHDTFGLACTARGYEERGFPGHLNCSDNISDALDPFGVVRRSAWPAINFFWSTWVDRHTNLILTEEAHSRPGDYVAMEALDDLVCVSTACPDDIDPINGWNPTDVHVRIYRPDAPVRRAIAYREREDAQMTISEESAFHPRLAALTEQFAPARDLWAPVTFPISGTLGEYWACREAVTVQDMSGLRKFDVIGPDAERLLQRAMTRNVAKLAVWRGTYSLMCDAAGTVIDDGTLFRLGPELFRWCCGSEESGRALKALAEAEGLQVRVHAMRGAMPNLAVQGPRSRDLLRKIAFTQPHVPSIDHLKWFGVTVARLGDREGAPFMLSRSGYTGELGYELFCAKADAVEIWDAVVAAGAEFGIKPMGSAALEIIRIEAGLAAAGAEFAPGVDAHEAGLGFAVDLSKSDFVGKAALERNGGAPRRRLAGLLIDVDDVPAHGAPVLAGERPVGEVTSATRSPMLERAVAMARIAVEHAEPGTRLEVGQLDGRMKRLGATVADIPFVDPQRQRARA
ncbi:MAG: DUF1989 domain-containing protein [Pseudomonadota bacterium]